ncbi:hypothetical protein RUND412_002950 [Rhizina undulata]
MAAERQLTFETIANLKRALATQSDASDSDDSITYTSNRGRKLKRKARFVHEGALDDCRGPRTYKEEIEFHGKRRKIIYRKPTRRKNFSESESESSSEESEDDNGSSSDELDSYADIKLDKLLAPLTSAADLPSHPSLAHIYTAPTLNELIQQALDKICEEGAHTMKLKNLLTNFLGDDPFINMSKMEWPNEDHSQVARERGEALLKDLRGFSSGSRSAGGSTSGATGAEAKKKLVNGNGKASSGDEHMGESQPAEPNGHTEAPAEDQEQDHELNGDTEASPPTVQAADEPHPDPSVTAEMEKETPKIPPPEVAEDDTAEKMKIEDSTQEETAAEPSNNTSPHSPPPSPPPRRMTTRSSHANAISPTDPKPYSPQPEIDAFFFPPNFRVDRDYGLPASEAEDTRRLLATAVQREDEFLRGLQRVREGLLRAERLRKTVWGWCRAMEGIREYHQNLDTPGDWDVDDGRGVGLSDGEDWYDMDAWGLDGPLEKGKEEEEEDQVVQGKKTRGRRQ